MSNLTNYYTQAKIRGASDAMKGIPRDQNPYLPGAHSSFNRQDWFDGWDEAMIPDSDEMPGGGPL